MEIHLKTKEENTMHTQDQLNFIWSCYQHMTEAFRQQVTFVDYALGNFDEFIWFGEE